MDLQITWFVLWGVLWAVYFLLDGFVLGTGMLHTMLGRSDTERRVLLHTLGPVWNGNEVWLITAGGATFAAFPTAYAVMFSYLYTPLLLLLFALIVRGISIEFRDRSSDGRWRSLFDGSLTLASFVITLLFGVAFGNLFQGLPMDRSGYHGTFLGLLNPYGLLTGVLFLLLFALHGALYVSVKTSDALSHRAAEIARRLWMPLLAAGVAFLAYSGVATRFVSHYLQRPWLVPLPVLAVAALLAIRYFLSRNALPRAFAASSVAVLMTAFTGIAGLYPTLIPSTIDPAFDLTIVNSSSSPYTLGIMTVVAFILVPVVIAYKIWVYRLFRNRVTDKDLLPDAGMY